MTHKLLLADDSVTIQRVVELTFSGEDVQVVAVGDGEQAISRIPIERPDIVLADIGMPKRNGYEVAAFVKGQPELSHIPVLLLAGAFEPVDEARAQQVRCDGVLVKPFEPQQIIARVRELVDAPRSTPPMAAVEALHRTEQPVAAAVAVAPEPPAPVVAQASADVIAFPVAVDGKREAGAAEIDRIVERAFETGPAPAPAEVTLSSPPGASAKIEGADAGLDDYFDRLDAAFARLGSMSDLPDGPQASQALDDLTAGLEIPTVNGLLGPNPADLPLGAPASPAGHFTPPVIEPPERGPMLSPSSYSVADSTPAPVAHEAPGRNIIADAFTALLASEQGEDVAAPVLVAAPPAQPVITEELVDEVTRRVLQRLAPDAAHDLVAQIVSEIAERLIREEIEKIKTAVGRP